MAAGLIERFRALIIEASRSPARGDRPPISPAAPSLSAAGRALAERAVEKRWAARSRQVWAHVRALQQAIGR